MATAAHQARQAPQAAALPEECAYEMANLSPKRTGLSRGYIYMSSRAGCYDPRVKYFRGAPGEARPSASVSVSDAPVLLADSIRMKPGELREVVAFVKLNKPLLLQFWYDHDKIKDIGDFIARFQSIRQHVPPKRTGGRLARLAGRWLGSLG